ncbi:MULTISPECIES: ABC transporter ATP-binding protein [Gemella]|uniref:ABC transporter ATP-binding protein n=1 Tax=Gemella TaxID=1378 RepID=UPI000768494F|nr:MULTISPECIES: ABC transporter ATP-binding protein [Gemella]AME08965.1 ABC transporter ATP-binding protein [Gemella sp. oral taxon 928]AXI26534.1 ABC transporter ATP-binding protein [Gemella sp. ND 6198]
MFLVVKNLNKAYGTKENRINILKDINFSLEKGTLCTLLGPSGSGKSTLLNAIGGLEKIDSGSIIINEFEVSNLKQKDLTNFRRKYLGFVFQFYNLIPDLTVTENIQVGSFIHNNPMDIEKLIKDLSLWEHRNKYPRQLSGGQQQRCAIGRALIKKPEILLCDEPTGALDYKTSKDILSLLQKINKEHKTTIIIATHNEEITKMSNTIIRLKDGAIAQKIENEKVVDAQELEW